MTNKIKRQLKLIEKLLITILIYNNFNYAKDRRDKRINKIRQFKFITTIFIFEFYESNLISLRKMM